MVNNFYSLNTEIGKKVWGFNPSRDIKAGHFANAFFRAITGNNGNIDLLLKAASAYRRGTSITSNEVLLKSLKDLYYTDENREEDELLNKVDELRTALDLVFNQDSGLFKGASKSFSSLTLSHPSMISGDHSDNETGKFIAKLLVSDVNNQSVDIIRKKLIDTNDSIYLLASPMIQEIELGVPTNTDDNTQNLISEAPYLKNLQASFETLSKYANRLEKTVFLQKVVTLGYLSLFIHLLNRHQDSRGLIPIFLVSVDPTKEGRDASRVAFIKGRQNIKNAFETGVKDYFSNKFGSNLSKQDYINQMKVLLPDYSLNNTKDITIWNHFINNFEGSLVCTSNVDDAFASAYTRTAFAFYNQSDSPETTATFIGRNVGLVYPRESGRGEKYFIPNSRFLDALVAALILPDEEIPVEEFWQRAKDNFGIVVGAGGTADTSYLNLWGIRQISPKQAAANAKEINSQLKKMGYVTEYADEIAMIKGDDSSHE